MVVLLDGTEVECTFEYKQKNGSVGVNSDYLARPFLYNIINLFLEAHYPA